MRAETAANSQPVRATLAMHDDTLARVAFPSAGRKKLTVALDADGATHPTPFSA
jgi:hypothetical protein